jgi:hypothetical protein
MKEILKYKQNQSLKKGHWKRTGYITTKNKKKRPTVSRRGLDYYITQMKNKQFIFKLQDELRNCLKKNVFFF